MESPNLETMPMRRTMTPEGLLVGQPFCFAILYLRQRNPDTPIEEFKEKWANFTDADTMEWTLEQLKEYGLLGENGEPTDTSTPVMKQAEARVGKETVASLDMIIESDPSGLVK